MANAYAQFRGVMTVELSNSSNAAFAQFQTRAERAGEAGSRSLDRMNRSVAGIEGNLRAAGAGLGAFTGYGGRLASQFNAAANAIAITGSRIGGLITAAAGGATLVGATTDLQNYLARLRAASDGNSDFASSYQLLQRVSSATRSDLGETINFYTRLKLATAQLGLSQNQLGGIITTVQQAIRLSGAGAQEANAALIQFVQGISSANGLSGDEFKSLGENATQVLRAIAQGIQQANLIDGFDGTISSLRKLGSEGKLTADVVVPALERVAGSVASQFQKLPPTVDQATTAIRNSFLDLIARTEQSTGVLTGIANALLLASANLDKLAIPAGAFAALLGARLVPGLIGAGAALLTFAGGVATVTRASFAYAGAAGVASAATSALSATLGRVLTPVRLVQGALVLLGGGLAFSATQKSLAAKAASDMGVAEEDLGAKVRALTGYILSQNTVLERNNGLLSERAKREAGSRIEDSADDDAAARSRLRNRLLTLGSNAPLEARPAVLKLSREIVSGLAPAEIQNQLNELEKRFPTVFRQFGANVDRAADEVAVASARLKTNQIALGEQINSALSQNFPLKPLAASTGGTDAAQSLKQVQAEARAAATTADTLAGAAARYRQAKVELDATFKVKGQSEFGKLSTEQQQSYAAQLSAIETNYAREVEGIKAAQVARRQAASEQRKDEQLAIRAINAIAREMPDSAKMLQGAIDAANAQARVVNDIRTADQARLAILDLQLAGEDATAEVLSRALDLKNRGLAVDAAAIEYLARQVEGEAQRNIALERRQRLLDLQARSLGQLQGAFTTLFSGDLKGFAQGIGQTFRQQFAQGLSLQIFGDAEADFRRENNGALKANTTAVENLIGALEATSSRMTDRPAAEANVGPGLAPAANDNLRLPQIAATLDQSASALDDIRRLFRDGSVRGQISGGGSAGGAGSFLGFGFNAGTRLGGSIGDTLDAVFGNRLQQDPRGAGIPGTGKLGSLFGKVGGFLGAAGTGVAAGDSVVGLLGDLGIINPNSKQAKTGRAVGILAGGAAGAAIGGTALGLGALGAKLGIAAGPLGALAGAAVGAILGPIIGALTKRNPFGDVALSTTGTGAAGSVFNSRGAGSGEQALTLADAVNDGLGNLARQLNLNVRGGQSLGALGFSGEQFFFNPTGGDFKASGNQRFANAEDAVAAAIRNAVNVGAFEGLRDSTRRLLLAGADLNAQAQKASEFESVFTELRRALDPAGAAAEELNRKFTRLNSIFIEAGASADEFGQLQQLYDLQRSQALAQANTELRDFLTQLTTSQGSGLSVRDRQRAAQEGFAQFQADIEAGRSVDQGRFREAAQTLLDVNRELFGSQADYFASLTQITDLTRQAITNSEQQTSLPEALRFANQPVTDGIASLERTLLDGLNGLNSTLARALQGGGVANDWAGSASRENFGLARAGF